MQKPLLKFIAILLFFSLLPAFAMAQFLADINGRPIVMQQYTDVQGSPYLTENWTKGLVKLHTGKTYAEVALKYDQVADQLLFRGERDEAMSFVDAVEQFSIRVGDEERVFRSGFKPAEKTSASTFYQVLYNGKIQLLKRCLKQITEEQAFNSATKVKTISENPVYYLASQGQPLKFKKDKKSVLSVMEDHAGEVEKFIASEKINLKSDADVIKLFAYYDSLLH